MNDKEANEFGRKLGKWFIATVFVCSMTIIISGTARLVLWILGG